MNFINKISELGKKAGNFYGIARKGLDTVVSLGNKARDFIKSEPIQTALEFLPAPLRGVAMTAGRVGEKVLTGLETLQSKLNTGEALAKRVKSSFDQAKGKFELERQKNIEPKMDIMEQGSSIRVPTNMITGGSQRENISNMTGVAPQGIMTF